MYLYVYIYICTYLHIYIYTYIYIYTHAQSILPPGQINGRVGNRTLSIYHHCWAMARTVIETFLMTICMWLELDVPRRGELLDKVEGMADCLAKIIRHIGFSSITEHLATVWILSRRALCVMRGIPVENTANITIGSMGAICHRT